MTYAYAPPSVDVHVTGRRIVATFVDSIVLGLIFSVFRGVFGLPAGKHTGLFGYTGLSGAANVAWLVVIALYYILLEGFFGRTVGKFVTGIKVVREADGQTPGLSNAFLRTLLRLIDGIAGYLIGFIIVVNSSRRRRLGDMAANTLVVRV
jgi:uncharacterized RDD family membrane protein YckC